MKKFLRFVYNFQTREEMLHSSNPSLWKKFLWLSARTGRNLTIVGLFVATGYISAITYNSLHPVTVYADKMVEVEAEQEFPPMLQKICNAEVTGNPNTPSHQFNKDGSVVRGSLTPSDIGYCQINEAINNDLARKLGYDIFTEKGNKEFAIYLFNHRGVKPWNSSKYMWDK